MPNKYDLKSNRAQQRDLLAAQLIGKDAALAQPDTGLYTIVAPDPRGGWVVRGQDGGLIHGVQSQTNRGLGVGAVVSISQGTREAYLDAKPIKANGLANGSGNATSGSGTGTGLGGSGTGGIGGTGGTGPGGSPVSTPGDGSTPRYRPNENGECTAVYYTGATKEGDFDDPAECAGGQPNSKSYYCEGGKCYATAPGSGRYDSLEDCEAAIIPGFQGGQCEGVNYTVKVSISATSTNADGTFDGGTVTSDINLALNSTTLLGAISGIRINPTFSGVVESSNGTFTPVAIADGSVTSNGVGIVSFVSGGYAKNFRIANMQIIRGDGLPDQCGSKSPSCPP